MEKKSCKVGLKPDKKYGYRITVEGDCEELLDTVKENLGTYGRRYLEDRIEKIQKESEASSPAETL